MLRKRTKWSPEERDALVKGVKTYGVGAWNGLYILVIVLEEENFMDMY